MKKLMGLAGLSAVLASCGGLSSDGQVNIDTNSLKFESGYGVENAAFQGGTYSGPAICNNLQTPLQLTFNYRGNLQSVTLYLVGSQGGVGQQTLPITGTTNSGSSISIQFYSNPNTVPLSVPKIAPQAIIVVPKANVIGATRVRIVGNSTTGGKTGELYTNYVPVVDNCPAS